MFLNIIYSLKIYHQIGDISCNKLVFSMLEISTWEITIGFKYFKPKTKS